MTNDELAKKIGDLERRIDELERRPVYIPVPQWIPPYWQPPAQPYPVPPWTIIASGTAGEQK